MINWIYYPKSKRATPLALNIVEVFEKTASEIDSHVHFFESNDVLRKLTDKLALIGFRVERGKKKVDKISVPVLFGLQGKQEKSFDADAYHPEEGFVVEIEAGRAVVNNQFLKDLFQACMMHEVHYLAIAIRNDYNGGNDFEKVMRFFDTLYASSRLSLPLKGILIIGY